MTAGRILYLLVMVFAMTSASPVLAQQKLKKMKTTNDTLVSGKLNIEIWSDVMCPFCYIGKRKFEKALAEFEHKDEVEVVWKSFQLNPQMKTEPGKNVTQYLAEAKGWSLDYAQQMTDHVTNLAKAVGLTYHMENAVVANSFDAHRFIQMAKKENKGDAAEEALFKAYFTDGKNTADHKVLTGLATGIGMDSTAVKTMLSGTDYTKEVNSDIAEAEQLGLRGVPFFVLNRQYGVSGAQEPDVFLQSLKKAHADWKKNQPLIVDENKNGSSCTPEGKCD